MAAVSLRRRGKGGCWWIGPGLIAWCGLRPGGLVLVALIAQGGKSGFHVLKAIKAIGRKSSDRAHGILQVDPPIPRGALHRIHGGSLQQSGHGLARGASALAGRCFGS
jgi:hypothetical protein